jgi:flagellar FliL protein
VATATEAADGDAKPAAKKSKKLLIIIGAAVVILALAGGGAFWYISKQRAAAAAAEDGGDEPAKAASHDAHATPPAYLPMDNMVVNLADPGGDRVAQIGITLVVTDAHTSDTVKAYLPTIRSGVLMLISQKTATELLTTEGKEALAKGILREASIPFGGGEEEPAAAAEGSKKKKKAAHADYPVTAVLFSSFIVQ